MISIEDDLLDELLKYVEGALPIHKRVGGAAHRDSLIKRLQAAKATKNYPSDCGSCFGYGHFDEDNKPTMDKRCRKCLDCNGTGEHQP